MYAAWPKFKVPRKNQNKNFFLRHADCI